MVDLQAVVDSSEASLNHEELRQVLDILVLEQPQHVLEVGCHNGRSLQVWQDALDPAMIIGIELHPTEELQLRALDNPTWVVLYMDSGAVSTFELVRQLLHRRPLDFLFLDGDHTLEPLARDFQLYYPLVRPGGLIVFDDALPTDNSAVDVWEFLQGISGWEMVAVPGGHGMAVLRK